MILLSVEAERPPLRQDEEFGGWRIGNTRVLLEIVIHAFLDGATPETIVQRYSTLTLSDVYAVIAYFLRHREEVERYLAGRERQAEELSEHWKNQDLTDIRARIAAAREREG